MQGDPAADDVHRDGDRVERDRAALDLLAAVAEMDVGGPDLRQVERLLRQQARARLGLRRLLALLRRGVRLAGAAGLGADEAAEIGQIDHGANAGPR